MAEHQARRICRVSLSSSPDDALPDWAAITAVVLGVMAFAVAQGLTYPLTSLVLEARGVPAALIGLNAASFAVGLGAATLTIRRLMVAIPGDRLIVLALFGCSVSLAALWVGDSLAVWFVARLLLGVSAGTVFIVSEAWLHSACPDAIRGRVSGLYGAGMCAGFAMGPLAIPLVGTKDGFAFAMLAVYVAMVAFLTAILGRRARTRPTPVPAGGLSHFVKAMPVLVIMVFAFGLADIAAISGLPVYFVRTGHSESFAAIAVTAMALPTAVAQPLIGVLLDRFSRIRVAMGLGVIAGIGFLVLPLVSSEPLLLAVFAVMGAAVFGLSTCAQTLLGERARGGMLASGSAVFSLAYAVGSAGGSTLTGLTMEISPYAAPIATGIVVLLLTTTFALDRKPR